MKVWTSPFVIFTHWQILIDDRWQPSWKMAAIFDMGYVSCNTSFNLFPMAPTVRFGCYMYPMGIVVGHCVRPSVCLERRYRSNSLRISAISLKFGGIMHSTIEQIDIKIAMLGNFLRVPWNFEIFHDRFLWPGLTDDITTLTLLTHWGRDKIDAISQTTFSTAFSWMKIFEFRLKFHWSLFPRVQLTIFQHWFR